MAQNQNLGTFGQVVSQNTSSNVTLFNTSLYVGSNSGNTNQGVLISNSGLTYGIVVVNSSTVAVGGNIINSSSIGAANVATYLGNSSATVANVSSWITSNAYAAYTNATVFASNASNINTGTLAEARLPYRMNQNIRSTDSITLGDLTLTGNLYVGSNVNVIGANNLSIIDNMIYLNANNNTANPDLGFAGNYNDGSYRHTGFFRDASDGYWKVFDSYTPEPDANVYIDTTNTSFHLANFQTNTLAVGNTSTNWAVINTTGIFTTGTINAASVSLGSSWSVNSTGAYHTGTINAASVTVGSVVIANSTTFKVAGTVDIASSNVKNQTLTDGVTISWDTSSGQVATVTLGGNRTMAAPTNLKIGTYILHVVQDATGSRTLTWNSVFKWPAGIAPVLTTNANARDVISLVSDGTNLYGSYLTDVK